MMAESSFLHFPKALADGRKPKIVIFGAGHGTTYHGKDSRGHALAPAALRAASQEDASLIDHWDFDLGGPLFADGPHCCVDIGDVPTAMHDNLSNRARIETQTRDILSASAIPILVGGDDSLPIPFISAFADQEPLWIVQIDAHIDWRDEVNGEHYGYSSQMRRTSEMPHVAGMVQVGMRSVGSARLSELEAAGRYGSHIVTARSVHTNGVQVALQHIPEGARVVVTLDCDGLDPSVMPGVAARAPGGLTYTQVIDLITEIGHRGRIVGFDLVELYPPADIDGLSAMTAARILIYVIGTIVRQD